MEVESALSPVFPESFLDVEGGDDTNFDQLDDASLPRLEELSSVCETLSSPSLPALGALPELPALSLTESLSPRILSPSDSSVSGADAVSMHDDFQRKQTKVCCGAAAELDEMRKRLKAAGGETAALRKRVANLAQENKQLRASLNEANDRLENVGSHQNGQMLLGLATISADMAKQLTGALSMGSGPACAGGTPSPAKKRKRTAAGSTLACVVLMCGFFFGTKNVLSDGSASRTDGNLPAVWSAENSGLVQRMVSDPNPPVRPRNCIRPLEPLPPGEGAFASEDVETVVSGDASIADSTHETREPSVGLLRKTTAGSRPRSTEYSYVLCRDSPAAIDHVKACSQRMRNGQQCGPPHTISLIMPASAVGLGDDEHGQDSDDYAEVHCSIVSVARIPKNHEDGAARPRAHAPYGRIVATVPDRLEARV